MELPRFTAHFASPEKPGKSGDDFNKKQRQLKITYPDVCRDFSYNYFGIKTLEKTYLLKINGKVAERPQHMLMRVSLG